MACRGPQMFSTCVSSSTLRTLPAVLMMLRVLATLRLLLSTQLCRRRHWTPPIDKICKELCPFFDYGVFRSAQFIVDDEGEEVLIVTEIALLRQCWKWSRGGFLKYKTNCFILEKFNCRWFSPHHYTTHP